MDQLASGNVSAAFRTFDTAKHLARYALRLILHQSYTIIHEMGHTFRNDDFHCRDYRRSDQPLCCFDTAAKAFMCRVRARLGIPVDELNTARSGDDFDNPINPTVDTETCSSDYFGDLEIVTGQKVSCFTGVEGEPYHDHEAVIRVRNLDCQVAPGRVPTSTSPPQQTCMDLCEAFSQTPAELAACRENCFDAPVDPDDVEQPI